jgi:SAM-dependent methyltransferase
MRHQYRLAFVAGGLSSGLLRKLASGPTTAERLALELPTDVANPDGLQAWLEMGVTVGELRKNSDGYSLRGKLSRRLTNPACDAIAACIEEAATLDSFLITETPRRLCRGKRFTLSEQDARLVARSSRVVEPFIREAIDRALPATGPVNLFEIGCGSAAYIRYAAERNPELTALGLEMQPAAAALAAENIARWNLNRRVSLEVGDVLKHKPDPRFDIATLHQNIYYFPVEKRAALLRHVRAFLNPGGRLLLTTFCRQQTLAGSLLNLWSAMTEGCGPLPTAQELIVQLQEAGFTKIDSHDLIPGEGFYFFLGVSPGSA